jgi:dolichyl-phosphate beta-glucosyltransferase
MEYPKNRGKGGAVKAGMSLAEGKYVLMVDADGATTFSELDRVWQKLK